MSQISNVVPESKAETGEMSMLSHLKELRIRITWAAVAWVICTTISFSFAGRLFDFLIAPYGELLQVISPTEPLEAFFKVSFVAGAVLAMPIIVYQLWRFVGAGLLPHEKRYVYLFVPSATFLFLLGILFGWLVLIPTAIRFLSSFMSDVFITEWTSQEYIGFVTSFLFWLGVSFEMPIVIYLLARVNLVTPQILREQWRLAVLAIAVVAAAITPTVDPGTMLLTMAPLLLLYLLSFGLAKLGQRQFERSMAVESKG